MVIVCLSGAEFVARELEKEVNTLIEASATANKEKDLVRALFWHSCGTQFTTLFICFQVRKAVVDKSSFPGTSVEPGEDGGEEGSSITASL
jgi:hypothetical protein